MLADGWDVGRALEAEGLESLACPQGGTPRLLAGESIGPVQCPLHPRTPLRGTPPLPSHTFALPVRMRSEADVAAVLAVELRHEGLVGVADEQDGGIEGLDLLLAALVCLDANGPPAAPVVSLTFKPFPWGVGVGGGDHVAGEGGETRRNPPWPLLGPFGSLTHSLVKAFILLCVY